MKLAEYRVVLRARKSGVWQVLFFHDGVQLFAVPFQKQTAAEYLAAKIVDDLLRNRHEFSCEVQGENGAMIPIDLLVIAQRRKVRGS